MTTAAASLVAAVRNLYERYPYPHYPILARPRWEDGYASHSAFAQRLARDLGVGGGAGGPVLVAGCGEILPYVMRRWTHASKPVDCVDLSRRSLSRARLRNALTLGATRLHACDLDDFLAGAERRGDVWSHVDAYGVLHHMPNPARTLARIAAVLAPGGTLRLMVYNAPARHWTRELQRLFALLRLDRHDAADLALARQLLDAWRRALPALDERLRQIGPATLLNDARFVDTFLHAREARIGVARWWSALGAAGLAPFALFDRYAELDDLPNPLWQAPTASQVEERAADGRFENNVELHAVKPGGVPSPALPDRTTALLAIVRHPPAVWSNYAETGAIGWAMKRELWQAHVRHVLLGDEPVSARTLHNCTMPALQRLARLGAILPSQVDTGLRATLALPMADAMEVPRTPAPCAIAQSLTAELAAVLERRGLGGPRRLRAAELRLDRAQRRGSDQG